MNITLEDKYNKDQLFVLERIKKELLLNGNENNEVNYNLIVYPPRSNAPTTVDEQQIIELLKKNNVVSEFESRSDFYVGESEDSKNPKMAGRILHLSVNKMLFDEYYRKTQMTVYGSPTHKIVISNSGLLTYHSPDGKIYKGKLNTKSNGFHTIKTLASEPRRLFKFDEIVQSFDKTRKNSYSTPERQARDAITSIKKALNYSGDDLFITDYGFTLNCAAERVA